MSQLRQNIITRDWVIIASERAKRPNQFATERKARPPANRYEPQCPFCPGNEHQTSRELFRVEGGFNLQLPEGTIEETAEAAGQLARDRTEEVLTEMFNEEEQREGG